MTFNPEDVSKVAKAFIERHWELNESGKNCYIQCIHCLAYARYQGYDYHPAMIIHHVECPVLIAKDLLTER